MTFVLLDVIYFFNTDNNSFAALKKVRSQEEIANSPIPLKLNSKIIFNLQQYLFSFNSKHLTHCFSRNAGQQPDLFPVTEDITHRPELQQASSEDNQADTFNFENDTGSSQKDATLFTDKQDNQNNGSLETRSNMKINEITDLQIEDTPLQPQSTVTSPQSYGLVRGTKQPKRLSYLPPTSSSSKLANTVSRKDAKVSRAGTVKLSNANGGNNQASSRNASRTLSFVSTSYYTLPSSTKTSLIDEDLQEKAPEKANPQPSFKKQTSDVSQGSKLKKSSLKAPLQGKQLK